MASLLQLFSQVRYASLGTVFGGLGALKEEHPRTTADHAQGCPPFQLLKLSLVLLFVHLEEANRWSGKAQNHPVIHSWVNDPEP